jgi:hypothetical protein
MTEKTVKNGRFREGTGQFDDPVSRAGGWCIVEHCPNTGVRVRVTRDGHCVRYCVPHLRLAERTFV